MLKGEIAVTDNIEQIIPALRSLAVPIDDLRPDPENTVEHDKRSVNAIASSLEQYGQDQPLVVQRDGMVIRKGNGRWQAAKKLGWTHIAAVVVDEENDRATGRSVADNATADRRQWSYGQLNKLIQDASLTEEQTGWDPEKVVRMAERFADPDTLPGGVLQESSLEDASDLPASEVKVVHLFFDWETFPWWRKLIEGEMSARKCGSEAQCVLEVLRERYAQKS